MARDLSACKDATYCSSSFCEQVLVYCSRGFSGHFWSGLNTRLRVLAFKRRENQSERNAGHIESMQPYSPPRHAFLLKWQQKETLTCFQTI